MRNSKAGLFLIELIILILFFAIAGAICVRLFVFAHLNSVQSETLSQAVLAAQSAAEAYKCGAAPEQAVACLPGAVATRDGFDVLYDGEWNPVESAKAVYMVQVRLSQRQGVGEAQIDVLPYLPEAERNVKASEPSLYTLLVKKLLG